MLSVGSVVLAGTSGEGEMYRSNDYGETWIQSNAGFNTSQSDQVYSLYNHNGIIYAGAFNALYKSADLGLTWTNAYSGIYPGAVISGITSLGNDLYVVDNYTNGIYKSIDNAASWFNVNNGLTAFIKFNAILSFNGALYAASDLGIYRSIDNGGSWTEYNEGLSFYKSALSLAVLNNQLYLGTDQTAVWGRPIGSIIPVQLISFHANSMNNSYIKTTWVVAQEEGIQSYHIERALSGTNNFISLGTISSTNSQLQKTYEFNDYTAEVNIQYEYRIRIAEISSIHYSEIRTARIAGSKVSINISTGSTDGHVSVDVVGYKDKAEFIVINSIGQVIYKRTQLLDQGRSFIDVSSQPKGLYILYVKTAVGIKKQKFLIK